MNYDLIIKLAKLANNNPNENEANSAARRVCKLLAEGNFQFNGQARTAANKVNTPPTNQQYRTEWYDETTDFDWKTVEELLNRLRQDKAKRHAYNYGGWDTGDFTKKPPPPNYKTRNCSECGAAFQTTSTEMYPRCSQCLLGRKRKDKTIHQCKCGEQEWYYMSQKASWVCKKCAYHISIVDSTANNWKMA